MADTDKDGRDDLQQARDGFDGAVAELIAAVKEDIRALHDLTVALGERVARLESAPSGGDAAPRDDGLTIADRLARLEFVADKYHNGDLREFDGAERARRIGTGDDE